jgi:hypothetical protein
MQYRTSVSSRLGWLCLTVALAGCGGGGSTTTADVAANPPVGTAPTPAPAPAPAPAPTPAPTPAPAPAPTTPPTLSDAGAGNGTNAGVGAAVALATGCIGFPQASITTAVTLTRGCYNVTSSIRINSGGALTIPAGSVLRFGSGTSLTVNQGGSLAARGTADAPIFLTATDPTPGYWEGVSFVWSNSSSNELTHTVIEYGGAASSGAAALTTQGLSSSPARVKLSKVTLRFSANNGFGMSSNTILDQFEGVRSTGNRNSGYVMANDAGRLTSSSSYSGNSNDAVYVDSERITTTQTWRKLDAPYQMGDASYTVDGALTIEAGTTLKFGASSFMTVSQTGSLSAVGTAESPITFTGTDTTPGYWQGIDFVWSNSTNNQLRHVIVEYGGSGSNAANVTVSGLSSSVGRLKLANVTLRHSAGSGFYFSSNTSIDEFAAVKSTQNRYSGTLGSNDVHVLGGDSDFAGNSNDFVYVYDADISGTRTWRRLNVPYRLYNSSTYTVNGALTIEAGATLAMSSSSGLTVSQTGSLTALGTADAPITFRGLEATPGYWLGIDIVWSNSTANQIANAVIRDAGGGGSSRGAITLSGLSSSNGRLTLTNSTVTNSSSWGVYRGSNVVLTQSGNTFTGNASGSVGP